MVATCWPLRSTVKRSVISINSLRIWLTIMMVVPSALSRRSTSKRVPTSPGSAQVGVVHNNELTLRFRHWAIGW